MEGLASVITCVISQNGPVIQTWAAHELHLISPKNILEPSKYSGYLCKDCSAQVQVYCSLRGQSCSKRERLLKCTELATHHAQELAAKHICDPVLVLRWLIIPVGLNRIAVNYHILATPFAVLPHIQLGLGDTSILLIHTLPSIFNHQSIMVMST